MLLVHTIAIVIMILSKVQLNHTSCLKYNEHRLAILSFIGVFSPSKNELSRWFTVQKIFVKLNQYLALHQCKQIIFLLSNSAAYSWLFSLVNVRIYRLACMGPIKSSMSLPNLSPGESFYSQYLLYSQFLAKIFV